MIELKKKCLRNTDSLQERRFPCPKISFSCLLNMNLYHFQWGRCSILIDYIISGMPLHSIWYWHTRLHGRCFLNWRFWIRWWVDLASCWWHTRWMGLGRVGILRTKTMKPQGKWWWGMTSIVYIIQYSVVLLPSFFMQIVRKISMSRLRHWDCRPHSLQSLWWV